MMDNAKARPTFYPAMRYADARAAMTWLADAFGFTQHFVVPGEGDTIVHAEMAFGNGFIMLGSAYTADGEATMRLPRDLGAVTSVIYVYVADIDAHYARARAAGATITRELRDTEYGSREYDARDPEGYAWTFGTYLPD